MDKYESSEASWRNERESLGLVMNYYHPHQEAVSKTWQALKQSVSNYLACADKWHFDNPIVKDTSSACLAERDDFASRLNEFAKSLEANRIYAWEGWESPDKLRQTLEKR